MDIWIESTIKVRWYKPVSWLRWLLRQQRWYVMFQGGGQCGAGGLHRRKGDAEGEAARLRIAWNVR